jgi:hypothetical protein
MVAGRAMMTPFILCALISATSALVSLGFSIAAERTATGPARTMALYACVRSLALFVASVVPFLSGSVGWLLAVAWSMIIVQALDAIVGMTIKDNVKTFGPAATALLNLAAVIFLIRST